MVAEFHHRVNIYGYWNQVNHILPKYLNTHVPSTDTLSPLFKTRTLSHITSSSLQTRITKKVASGDEAKMQSNNAIIHEITVDTESTNLCWKVSRPIEQHSYFSAFLALSSQSTNIIPTACFRICTYRKEGQPCDRVSLINSWNVLPRGATNSCFPVTESKNFTSPVSSHSFFASSKNVVFVQYPLCSA